MEDSQPSKNMSLNFSLINKTPQNVVDGGKQGKVMQG